MIPLRQIQQINAGDTLFSVIIDKVKTTFYLEQIEHVDPDSDEAIMSSGIYITSDDSSVRTVDFDDPYSVNGLLLTPVYVAFVDCKVTEQNLRLLTAQIQTDKPELFI